MANKISSSEVLCAVAKSLDTEFGYDIYSDEVKEDFKTPCFFIQIIRTDIPQTVNLKDVNLAVVITFFTDKESRNEETYLDVEERIREIFEVNYRVQERVLKVDSVSAQRIGELHDILQITIDMPYTERVTKHKAESEVMEEVQMNVSVNKGEGGNDIWQS